MSKETALDPLLDFRGKVVLVTGATQGFGKLLAEQLTRRGAKLVLGDIKHDALIAVADRINAEGGTAILRMHRQPHTDFDGRSYHG